MMEMTLTLGELITAAGLIGGAIAFFVGLGQYQKAQKWKRAEWVAAEIRQFWDIPSVVNAMAMIDWGERTIQLFPDREKPEARRVFMKTNELVTKALMSHKEHGRFSEEEAAIRDCFDCFLDGLERFEAFIVADLIDVTDLQPYLDYWIERISLRHPSAQKEPRLQQLAEYIKEYEFDGVSSLMKRFGELHRNDISQNNRKGSQGS